MSELLVACAVIGLVVAMVVPQVRGFQQITQALAAARYVAGRLQHARTEALKHSAHVAVGFVQVGSDFEYAVYLDGNGNGVRSADITSGTDTALAPAERLAWQFPGARFGIVEGTPSIDNTGPLTGADPIRVGRSGLVSFSPLGGVTPGTIYLHGSDQRQWAVRMTGATGRVRVLEFDVARQQWRPR